PVPRAYLAVAAPGTLPTSKAPKLRSTSSSLVFASTDVGTPSVAQIVLANGQVQPEVLRRVADTLLQNEHLGWFYGFDAWLANVDRNIGNILLGSQVYLIDHGRCCTGPVWTAADLVPSKMFRHRLKEWLTPLLQAKDLKVLGREAAGMTHQLAALNVED